MLDRYRLMPFGAECAEMEKWKPLERLYIKIFGIVDLPSRLRARLINREVQKMDWHSLLDLGCGVGAYAFFFSRCPEKKILGIDINELKIKECRKIASHIGRKNVTFLNGEGQNILSNMNSNSIDVIVAVEALVYFRDIKSVFQESHRVLKQSGYFVGHVPVSNHLRNHEKILLSDNILTDLLQKTGFEIESITPTFGKVPKFLCKIFKHAINSHIVTAIMFPFLLLFSKWPPVKTLVGDYRMFVARKQV